MAAKGLTIYLDGRCLLRPKDGVGSYVQHLLENVLALDKINTYIALGFADQRHNKRLVAERANFTYLFLPMPRRAYMGLFRFWQSPVDRFLPSKPDVVWYPDFVAAPRIKKAGRKILTIHDLTFIHSPDVVERKNLKYLRRFVRHSVEQVDTITTVSYAMEQEIRTNFNTHLPITVIYPAAPAELPGTPAKDRYILFVGTLQPRKNLKTLLKAYMLLPESLRRTYKLVLAGRRGWKDTEVLKLMDQTPHTWVDGPTDEILHNLYLHASLFVLPSLQEGFGIPSVEALAHHIPVITSDDPALIEATGKAALHVPAQDANALANAMGELLQDKRLVASLASHRTTSLAKLDGAANAASFIRLFSQNG